jgi:hypothetical protein
MTVILLALLTSSVLAAGPGHIADFNYQLTDIAQKGLTKEHLFSSMMRNNVDLEHSICSNKAHVWAYEFSRRYNVEVGKIFMFFGSSVWENESKGWMYHVAPYVVENGQEYVMEASYPSDVTAPLTVNEWLENETDGRIKAHNCKEIFASDKDLTQYFYERYNLPEIRSNGKGAVCYFRKVPEYYWYPASIALHDLKKDIDGNEIEFNPTDFDQDDVLEACVEITSSKLGLLFGNGRKNCKRLLGL